MGLLFENQRSPPQGNKIKSVLLKAFDALEKYLFRRLELHLLRTGFDRKTTRPDQTSFTSSPAAQNQLA